MLSSTSLAQQCQKMFVMIFVRWETHPTKGESFQMRYSLGRVPKYCAVLPPLLSSESSEGSGDHDACSKA